MTGLRVLVCGSRHYADRGFIYRTLDALHATRPIGLLIEGECPYGGADLHARQWAQARGVPVDPYPPDMGPDGHVLGPARNARMLHLGQPDAVVAFPDGQLTDRSGTGDMVTQARAAGVPVRVYERLPGAARRPTTPDTEPPPDPRGLPSADQPELW